MKKFLLSILISSFSYSIQSQTNTKAMNRIFEIAEFQIAPDEQVVYYREGRTFTFADGGHGHGYVYVPDKNIDFNLTSLIFMGQIITFKEYFPILTTDISSLKIIQQSIGYNNNQTIVLSPLENKIYIVYNNGVVSPRNISGYTHIRQLIFKDEDGSLRFVNFRGGHDMPVITKPVDEASIQHVFENYYTDKDGLYYFDTASAMDFRGRFGINVRKLESSDGKPVEVVLHQHFFVYGDTVYPYNAPIEETMRLNINELNLITIGSKKYIRDRNNLFRLGDLTPVSLTDIIQHGTPPEEPVSEWKYFGTIAVGRESLKENTLYYTTLNSSGTPHSLIKTPSGFYGISINRPEVIKFDNVMIYNIEKDDYESIEVEQFRELTINYYVYKNQMYYTRRSYPVESELNIQKLQAICLNGKATQFYTDGTFLVGGYNFAHGKSEQRGEQTWRTFENPLFRDVDWESLQVVSETIMVDKNTIYQVEGSVLQIIPIKDLNLDVKVIPLMDR